MIAVAFRCPAVASPPRSWRRARAVSAPFQRRFSGAAHDACRGWPTWLRGRRMPGAWSS